MKKINNSNFEILEDIIKNLDLNYNQDSCQNIEQLNYCWTDITGEKISKISKVYHFSADNILTIVCADSFTANELYFEKENLLNYMNEKAQSLGIIIKDIKFNYKKWKENNDK